jgi:hypothetical protein
MSTKATIAYGKNFHLFREMMEQEHIYLELETTNFEAGYGQVTVPIPVHIWEVIREFPGVQLDLADLSDAELRKRVEREVDERIEEWNQAQKRDPKSLLRWAGGLAFGAADEPRAKQLQKGLRYYRNQWKWQREVKAAIEKLRWENTPEGKRKRLDERNRWVRKEQAARKK